MNPTLFKEVSYSLSKLIEDIELGEIGLPDIQRPFVWNRSKVRDLFDSMYSGFPVGYLLFWSNGVGVGAKQIGTEHKQAAVPRLLIVDGQQRLTSLFAVMKGVPVIDKDYTENPIKIAFRPRDNHFAVPDAATVKDPEFIEDITELWVGDRPRNRFVKDFIANLRSMRDLSEDEEDQLVESIDRLYDLRNYPFTALELSATVDAEKAAEVFVRINSEGVQLNQADFILTLMSVFWDKGRKQLEDFSRAAKQPSTSAASPFNHFIEPDPDQMLRVAVGLAFRRGQLRHVYSILRGKDLETEQFSEELRDQQFAVLADAQEYTLDLTNWHEFLKVLVRAGFRSSGMITSKNNLLYAYVLYLIGKRDFGVDRRVLRDLIARWFAMSSLTGRYTSSPESTIGSDLASLRGKSTADEFVTTLDRVIRDTVTKDYWEITLPNALATSASASPALYAYYAALNLLDAKVLFSDLKVSELFDPALRAKRSSLERHHLFPRAYLESIGVSEQRERNQIANFALLEWPDNAEIGASPPSDYFPTLVEHIDPVDLPQTMFWHALPHGWETMDYADFLVARRRLMAGVIRAGFDRLSVDDAAGAEPTGTPIVELISIGESEFVEFKAAARYNQHTGTRDEKIEAAIVKTVAAFLNAKGGQLLIGVNDDGQAIGLDNDYQLLKKPNRDGFELWLTDLLQAWIGKPASAHVSVRFDQVDGYEVCRVAARPSPAPVFVNPPKGEKISQFFVRIGNSTRQMTTDEVLEYQKHRWDGP